MPSLVSEHSSVRKYLERNGDHLKKYDLGMVAIWQVTSEGDDRAGSHLGYVRGQLRHAILWGTMQLGFYTYGHGGSFKKVEIIDVDSVSLSEKQRLRERIEATKAELAELEAAEKTR
jgi:hypothetical protein